MPGNSRASPISVQLVGLYLVFATLIVPPLGARRMTRYRLYSAWVIGIAGYAFGLMLSTEFDLPTGPVIVWMLAVLAVAWDAVVAMRRRERTRAAA